MDHEIGMKQSKWVFVPYDYSLSAHDKLVACFGDEPVANIEFSDVDVGELGIGIRFIREEMQMPESWIKMTKEETLEKLFEKVSTASGIRSDQYGASLSFVLPVRVDWQVSRLADGRLVPTRWSRRTRGEYPRHLGIFLQYEAKQVYFEFKAKWESSLRLRASIVTPYYLAVAKRNLVRQYLRVFPRGGWRRRQSTLVVTAAVAGGVGSLITWLLSRGG